MSAAGGREVRLADEDKARIIESILLDVDFLNRGLRVGESKEVVYLSTENISPGMVPEVRGVKIVLLSPEEVDEKAKDGLAYYAFGVFKVKGAKVLVSFGHTWRSDRSRAVSYRTTRYEYRKAAGRWRGREVSFSMGRS